IATAGTAVWHDDIVFAGGGYPKSGTVAVRVKPGSAEVVWSTSQKVYEQSMLAHDGYVYAMSDSGVAYCWRANDGKEMWKQRLAGPVSASPVLVGDVIYMTNERGKTFVFRANPEKYEEVAVNQLGEDVFATLSVVDSRIYMRTGVDRGNDRKEYLYCIGN
ncbi:MAG: outer membrane protein assembly factor BamB family protein, partial [Planctomycetota bacterium]